MLLNRILFLGYAPVFTGEVANSSGEMADLVRQHMTNNKRILGHST